MSIIPLRDLLYIIPIRDPMLDQMRLIQRPRPFEKKLNQGVVKYRGPLTSGEVKVGDHVLFSPHEGDEIVLEGEGPLVLLRERSVDLILLDSQENHLFTPAQIKMMVERSVTEMIRLDPEQAESLNRLASRLIEHLASRFHEETYF